MVSRIEGRLRELGLELPQPHKPVANYRAWNIQSHRLHIAGQGPIRTDGTPITGVVGVDLTIEEGKEAAAIVALNLITQAKDALDGNLDRVVRWVKLFGMVNSPPDFVAHPEVINGASDLLGDVFGEAGRHARAAIGMASLPIGIAVEIDAVLEIA